MEGYSVGSDVAQLHCWKVNRSTVPKGVTHFQARSKATPSHLNLIKTVAVLQAKISLIQRQTNVLNKAGNQPLHSSSGGDKCTMLSSTHNGVL